MRAAVDVSVHRLHMNSRYGDFGPLTIRFGLGGKRDGREVRTLFSADGFVGDRHEDKE